MSVEVAAVVPAAGRSERFGRMKLLADVGGEPLLDHTLRCLVEAGIAPVVVVLSPDANLRDAALLRHADVRTVVNPDPGRGMFSSVQAGLAAVGARSVLVLPADMPFVRVSTVAAVAQALATSDRAVVARHDGRRGHPIGLPARLAAALVTMESTTTLKAALLALGEQLLVVDVDDEGVVRDVDRPEDLEPGR